MSRLDRGSVFTINGIGGHAEPCDIIEETQDGRRMRVRFADGTTQQLQRVDNRITNAQPCASPTVPWRLHR